MRAVILCVAFWVVRFFRSKILGNKNFGIPVVERNHGACTCTMMRWPFLKTVISGMQIDYERGNFTRDTIGFRLSVRSSMSSARGRFVGESSVRSLTDSTRDPALFGIYTSINFHHPIGPIPLCAAKQFFAVTGR